MVRFPTTITTTQATRDKIYEIKKALGIIGEHKNSMIYEQAINHYHSFLITKQDSKQG